MKIDNLHFRIEIWSDDNRVDVERTSKFSKKANPPVTSQNGYPTDCWWTICSHSSCMFYFPAGHRGYGEWILNNAN